MDKNKSRTDMIAAGRKKLQQFRKKKDGKGSKSSGKPGASEESVDDKLSDKVALSELAVDDKLSNKTGVSEQAVDDKSSEKAGISEQAVDDDIMTGIVKPAEGKLSVPKGESQKHDLLIGDVNCAVEQSGGNLWLVIMIQ